jgi:hypothetical protein
VGNLADHQRAGGVCVHIADCYVWAEIYYLDSPTDYREYLSENCALPRPLRGNPVMLDPFEFSRKSTAKTLPLWPVLLVTSMIFLFLLRFVDFW